MYFAVIGNHPEIALRELQLLHTNNLEKKAVFPIQKYGDHLILFDTDSPHQLSQLASLIKRGRVVDSSALDTFFQ
jgi:hypothetical protein